MKHFNVAVCAILNLVAFAVDQAFAEGTLWIGATQSRQRQQPAIVQKTFVIADQPTRAMLRVGADFCVASVTLNGDAVLSSTPYDLPIPVPAHRSCMIGDNILAVRIAGTGGPAAVAVELALTYPDGKTQLIRSDASWECVAREVASKHVNIQTFGRVDQEAWWGIRSRPSTDAFDEYNQWSEALDQSTDGGLAKLQLPDKFAVDVVYRVPKEQGSWISMTIDDRGRLIVGKESLGLLRLTLNENRETPRVEVINDDLKGCHGLLWSKGALFANASDSKALYRLRDTNGDDAFDEVRLLRDIPGGLGDHGRNDLVVGPDDAIYLIHGDAVDLPDGFESRVPATREFGDDQRPKGGHVLRTDSEGSTWEVVASGLRNPYGIDFNEDGEAFIYDADSERHVGLPWYRPTRMNHLVAGTDYGWRSRGELPWPIYHADILPPNVLIGRGSPTTVKFGYRSNFPTRYRRAFFAPDWAFGRVFAVHVVPRGASYSMHPETFLRGRPFNAVDMDFAPDGSMYLLTGGYKTRSVLYKLRYTGPPSSAPPPTAQEKARVAYSKKMRALRHKLEAFQRIDSTAVDFSWKYLDHPDRWIRHAARLTLEHQPTATWADRVWSETRPEFSLPALLALVRVSSDFDFGKAWEHLGKTSITDLPLHLQLTAIRIAQWLDEFYRATPSTATVISQFEAIYPTGRRSLDRELCSLLSAHDSRQVVRKTLDFLGTDLRQEDALHYLMVLSKTQEGWSDKHREEYFRLIHGARLFQGDEQMPRIVRQLEEDALARVPGASCARFSALLDSDDAVKDEPPVVSRPFVRSWQVSDFRFEELAELNVNFAVGKRVFREATCSKCHRLGAAGRAFGPDLTGISGRFTRTEILESILDPSRSVSSRYVNHVVATADGRVHTGQLVWNGFRKSIIRLATDPLNMEDVTEISKRDIVSHKASTVSPMPQGLLDSFEGVEIESLLLYIESGGLVEDER